MSLMKTLAKLAVGVALAKGAQSMMNKRSGGQGMPGGLGDLMAGLGDTVAGGARGRSASASAGTGLEDMLGGLLGGSGGALPGGLGGLLNSLGGAGGGGAGGGLQGVLAGLAGAAGGSLPGTATRRPQRENADFGQVLNASFDATPEPEIEPSADQEAAAALMLRAMIQAAKSDGHLDDAEKDNLIKQLGEDVDREEADFVQRELRAPVDIDRLIADTPRGMERQIYAVSVLGINLDHQGEAEYLRDLARACGISPQEVNAIHKKLGVPTLYA